MVTGLSSSGQLTASSQQQHEQRPSTDTMVCYNCDRPGHFARECPNSEDGGRPGWRGSGGGREPSVCYRCDRSGHLARDCPDTADRGSRSGGSVCYRFPNFTSTFTTVGSMSV